MLDILSCGCVGRLIDIIVHDPLGFIIILSSCTGTEEECMPVVVYKF